MCDAGFSFGDMSKTTIALCMIVKNESSTLSDALQSVSDIVDRMGILDTGSSDDTIAIAESFGAEIRRFDWTGDFAEARNISLNGVEEDWIWVMDGDDQFPEGEALRLRRFSESTSADALTVSYQIQLGHTPEPCIKAFRNHRGVKFEGMIHENIRRSLSKAGGRIESTDVQLLHRGYDERDLNAKVSRNIPLLEKELARARQAEDPMQTLTIQVDLGWCLIQSGEVAKGTALLSDSLDSMLKNGFPSDGRWELVPFVYLLTSLMNEEDYKGATSAVERYRDLFISHPAFPLYSGMAYLRGGDFDVALNSFNEFENQVKEKGLQFSVPESYLGDQLWEMQGDCFLSLGRAGEALVFFDKALKGRPGDPQLVIKAKLARMCA